MQVAVYSGSFNPLHKGHLAIMRCLKRVGYDRVYLVVTPVNPLKEHSMHNSGPDRFNSAVEAVSRYADLAMVKVDDIELGMPAPHYTINTLDALRLREPDNVFTLIMGADNLACIRRWKDRERILTEYGVAVYPRRGFDLDAIRKDLLAENPDFQIRILPEPMVDISSTEIREAVLRGEDVSAKLM